MDSGKTFRTAFTASIPVLLGYLAIGIAFGLLVVHAGFPWYLAPLMGIIIFAGAMQYLTIGLLTAGTGLAEIAAITFFVNSRHTVYGISLLDKFGGTGKYKPYLIYSLTDETYALFTSLDVPKEVDEPEFYFFISLLNQSYWVCASALGAILGKMLPINTEGLDFALVALFMVLALEQIKKSVSKIPLFIALFASVAVLVLLGPGNFLIVSLLLSIAVLLFFKGRLEE